MIADLKDAFDNLEVALANLGNHLIHERPEHHIPLTEAESASSGSAIRWAADLFSDLRYRDGQDGRETRSRHGLIIATPDTQALIHQANETKQVFARQVRAARDESESRWKEMSGTLARQTPLFRDSLNQSGLSRLHIRQCTRTLQLLPQMPVRCGFSWYSHGRSITRISVADAEAMLLELGEAKAHIQVQLSRLQQLKTNTPLARIQSLAPVVRANLVFDTHRKAMNCPLPLFLPADSLSATLPVYKDVPIEAPEGRRRKMREDDKINPEAFLPSIRVHTYR